jgi:hypothetical protein
MKNTRLFGARIFVCAVVMTLLSSVPAAAATALEASTFDASTWSDDAVGDVNPKVFALALKAAGAAIQRGEASEADTLTVIDFSRPSTVRRMWVFDLRSRALLFEELVSHGRGSGVAMATSFSNLPESNRSSLGLYRAAETYTGKHGYSLRMDGLERGINDKARERAIVMHAADYVNEAAAKKQGYLGRSLGCPALRPEVSKKVIDAVKGGGLIFAYYPDPQWLRTSKYLG